MQIAKKVINIYKKRCIFFANVYKLIYKFLRIIHYFLTGEGIETDSGGDYRKVWTYTKMIL